MNYFDIIYQLPERPVYSYCSITFTLRAKRFLLAWLLAFVKSFAWRISRVEWNHLNCPGKPKGNNPYNIEIRQLIFISNSRLIIDEDTRMFFTFPFILLHLAASSRRSDWITGMLAQRNVSRKKQRGVGGCRNRGRAFPHPLTTSGHSPLSAFYCRTGLTFCLSALGSAISNNDDDGYVQAQGVLRFSSDRDDRSGAKIKTQKNP